MLPEENRLQKQTDHDKVFRKGLKYKSPFFLLLAGKRDNEQLPTRFSFIISKKISKKAPERNRARRLLRETIRMRLKRLSSGYDCIFILNKNILNKGVGDIDESVEKVLIEAGILK